MRSKRNADQTPVQSTKGVELTVLQLLNAWPVILALLKQPELRGEVAFKLRRIYERFLPDVVACVAARDTLLNDKNSTLDRATGKRTIKPECDAELARDPMFAQKVSCNVRPLTAHDLRMALISGEQTIQLGALCVDSE